MRDDGDMLLHRDRQVAEKSENAATAFAAVAARPMSRMALALSLFRPGLTQWDSFVSLSPRHYIPVRGTIQLHFVGALYGFPFPFISACAVGCSRTPASCAPCTRFDHKACRRRLLIMTGVTQLTNPGDRAHCDLHWFAISLAIIALGRRTPIGGPGMVRNLLDSS